MQPYCREWALHVLSSHVNEKKRFVWSQLVKLPPTKCDLRAEDLPPGRSRQLKQRIPSRTNSPLSSGVWRQTALLHNGATNLYQGLIIVIYCHTPLHSGTQPRRGTLSPSIVGRARGERTTSQPQFVRGWVGICGLSWQREEDDEHGPPERGSISNVLSRMGAENWHLR